jgi:hypothetical protein
MKHVIFGFDRGNRCAAFVALAVTLTLIGCDMSSGGGGDPTVPSVPIDLTFEDGRTLISWDTENLTLDRDRKSVV